MWNMWKVMINVILQNGNLSNHNLAHFLPRIETLHSVRSELHHVLQGSLNRASGMNHRSLRLL